MPSDTADTPLVRLRASHTKHPYEAMCCDCEEPWPCDTIAALDALEAERDEADEMAVDAVSLAARHGAALNTLQARIDAATVLIREVAREAHVRHGTLLRYATLATCNHPNCAPFRAWLAGDKEDE